MVLEYKSLFCKARRPVKSVSNSSALPLPESFSHAERKDTCSYIYEFVFFENGTNTV